MERKNKGVVVLSNRRRFSGWADLILKICQIPGIKVYCRGEADVLHCQAERGNVTCPGRKSPPKRKNTVFR